MSDDTPSEALPADETRLLASLGNALGDDPPPRGLVERAEALVALLDLDHDLAELLDAPDAEFAGTRGAPGLLSRLAFEVADGSVSIEIDVDIGEFSGTVLSGDVEAVILESVSADVSTARVDDLGRFTFVRPPPGPHRLRLHTQGARPATTDWFAL